MSNHLLRLLLLDVLLKLLELLLLAALDTSSRLIHKCAEGGDNFTRTR